MTNHTAILYFARTPGNDLKSGQFENGRFHTRLISRLSRKTKQAIRASGIPAVMIDERLQKGDSFAERLTHAIQTVFEKGFEHVIAVGNDCPDLNSDHLLQAKYLLESGVNVLGPAVDGGDYLIGIRKSTFRPATFCGAFAKKEEVHTCLMTVLKDGHESPAELEMLTDIDDSISLLSWLKNRHPSREHQSFILFLLDFLAAKFYHTFRPAERVVRLVPFRQPHRGPPSLRR